MISHEITQLARSSLLLLDYAERQGLERRRLVRLAGLQADPIDDPDSRIKTAAMLKLWRAVIDRLDDPYLGLHVGGSIHARQLGLVGYAIFYSRNLHSAMYRFARYVRILSDAVQFDIEESAEEASFTWTVHPVLAALRHPVETGVALMVALGRELTDTDISPRRVELPGPQPDDVSEYRRYFGCPVEFDRPAARVTSERGVLNLPCKAPDATLVAYLDELATAKMNPLEDREEKMTHAVRRALWSMLPGGRPDLWRTAEELGVSVRTLQRRLGEEGSSFSRVLDELRRDLSNELLADRSISVSEVAFMLGYSEPSAFQRAYRRWWGVSARRGVA